MTGKDRIPSHTTEIGVTASNDTLYLAEDPKISFNRLITGNTIEKGCAQLIEIHFPNYEVFWCNYLEPLREEYGGRNWRYDMFESLEELALSQYGILKSLYFIDSSRPYITVGDPLQRFKNIYFHFGLILDLINNFCRNLCLIREKLGLTELIIDQKLSEAELLKRFEKWVRTDYNHDYDRMLKSGIPLKYYPYSKTQYLGLLIPDGIENGLKEFQKHVESINERRNFYIHNPGVDITITLPDKHLHAVKKGHLKEYRHWSKIRKYIRQCPSHFLDPEKMIETDLFRTLSFCNSFWAIFIIHMHEITCHKNYRTILYYNREA